MVQNFESWFIILGLDVGGCHAPDIIKVCGVKNVLPSSTNPTRPSVDDIFILMTYSKFWGDEYCKCIAILIVEKVRWCATFLNECQIAKKGCWETQKMRIASIEVPIMTIPRIRFQRVQILENNISYMSRNMTHVCLLRIVNFPAYAVRHLKWFITSELSAFLFTVGTDVTLMSNAQPNSRPDSERHAQEISPSEATEMLVQPHGSSNALLLAALPHIIQGFPVSCSSQHSEHLSNFCGFQLQSQRGQSVLPYLHYGDTRNVSSADLRVWGARAPYTSLKGAAGTLSVHDAATTHVGSTQVETQGD
ncbi:urease isoform X1 [Tanacetum coccineum]|uniref:Urease isoform X1 n=1 Tax=Tanacetum coccineum TaxID=301880 RepID=A0ABQ5HRY1_9ASTR